MKLVVRYIIFPILIMNAIKLILLVICAVYFDISVATWSHYCVCNNSTAPLTVTSSHNTSNVLREEGNESAFESEKLRVVPVMPIEPHKEWSLATIHQIQKYKLPLNKEKIISDNIAELTTILAAMPECKSGVVELFNALVNKNYFASMDSETFKTCAVEISKRWMNMKT